MDYVERKYKCALNKKYKLPKLKYQVHLGLLSPFITLYSSLFLSSGQLSLCFYVCHRQGEIAHQMVKETSTPKIQEVSKGENLKITG